jgi:transmembrane sensor
MEKDELYYRYLLVGFIANSITPSEAAELLSFIESDPESYHELMNSPEVIEELEAKAANPKIIIEAATRNRMKDRLMQAIVQRPVRIIPWKSWIAAASIILIVSFGFWFYNQRSNSVVQTVTAKTQDVFAPKSSKARITLGDGRTISLDSINNGVLAQQAGGTVTKTADGKIIYQQTTNNLQQAVYNTLSNPRGSKVIDMTLSDGSHVWLNAGSSITFPVAFRGNERKVTMLGEAYFEITKNISMPFKVGAGGAEVTVLGTHFNVNAYDDENDIKITLLEGAVKLAAKEQHTILKPGQQGRLTTNGRLSTNNDIDLVEVMAWKNGNFKFNSADIQTIMRQVARWYDLEVVYEHTIPGGHYRGTVSRDVSVQKMLEIIKISGVKFRIEAKKLIIE